jgi:GNAT superfamily N-acetyltransferase
MTTTRPMSDDDVAAVVGVTEDADAVQRRSAQLPDAPWSEDLVHRTQRRVRHFLASDPGGSWVAEDEGRVIGLAQAHRRQDLFVLSSLFVLPAAQNSGAGRALLDRVLAYGPDGPGLIVSSRDPRAVRRYALAGFTLHPTVVAWGAVRREGLNAAPDVRRGDSTDLELTAAIDQRQRGAARVEDVQLCLAEGDQLLVVPDRGYTLVRGSRVGPLAALDDEAASQLLTAALADFCQDGPEVSRMTARQDWAVRLAVAAGLEIHPHGPVFVRGDPGPMRPYLPDGILG